MDPNKPVRREKNVTGGTGSVHKRGDGLGTGPVGNGKRPGSGGSSGGSGNRAGGGGGLMKILIPILVLLLGGGGGGALLSGGLGGDSGSTTPPTNSGYYAIQQSTNDIYTADNSMDTSVSSEARDKYTKIKGKGKDQVTLMIYMCGTDLESRSGMATNDLTEIAKAKYGDNVNVLIYTGGCSKWKINGISSKVNQIYQIKDGKLYCIEKDMGDKSMVKPSTLTEFIKYCAKHYPANRQQLILWDHGGGSVSGYGYDEKNARAGSMSLSGIDQALKNAGEKFDFIGFDACLMATLETGLMLSDYADYMIASEETEPGTGWYYTNWLTSLGKNTSISTVELGKQIIDDFVTVCAQASAQQKTTLSIIDLAELSETVPDKFQAWSSSVSNLIAKKEYNTVATARAGSREFAPSTQIDQVDLIDLAYKMGTAEGKELCTVLSDAVKYNKTSRNMTNAYGVSIYFPYRKLNKVNTAVNEFQNLGMDSAYAKAIRDYASTQAAGQTYGGGTQTANPLSVLLGEGTSGGSSSGSSSSQQSQTIDMGTLLQMFGSMSGSGSAGGYADLLGTLLGMDSSSLGFLAGDRSLPDEELAEYVEDNQVELDDLKWKTDKEGKLYLPMTSKTWGLLTDIELNVFVDDGAGYIDLGLDNVYDVDEEGNLVSAHDNTWLAVNGQPVAYYYTDSAQDGDNYTINGYIPAMLNGERVKLLVVFDQDNPNGQIAGASTDYEGAGLSIEVEAKNLLSLEEGDEIDFLCDYYDYDGNYQDSYYLGETMTVSGNLSISNVSLGDQTTVPTYVLTDIYNQAHWIPAE